MYAMLFEEMNAYVILTLLSYYITLSLFLGLGASSYTYTDQGVCNTLLKRWVPTHTNYYIHLGMYKYKYKKTYVPLLAISASNSASAK